ncbi:MAG: hypothetical protein HWN67_16940 [Candidatus Helarchaeota archaeon]|nr:hypothetical protein [Candidatus Helarchaeota archaeon]
MNKRKAFLPLIAILIATVLLFLPVQPVQAIGPNLEEGANGFITYENESYIMRAVYANATNTNLNTGDKIRWNTTNANNSQIVALGGWIADVIWGTLDYYNITTGSWGGFMGIPTTEMFGIGYNSTAPINLGIGNYNLYSFGMPMMAPQLLCSNFAHANHSVVNSTYAMFLGYGSSSVLHTTPTNTIYNGSWAIWTTDLGANNRKMVFTYNNEGMMTRMQQYGAADWSRLDAELRLEEKGFAVKKGDNFTWRVTYSQVAPLFYVGDKIRWSITEINNTQPLFPPMIADIIWGTIELYNSTNGTWGSFMGQPTTEIAGFAFNSTHPCSIFGGNYSLYHFAMLLGMPFPPFIIPLSFTVSNHTIVNFTYRFFSGMGSSSFKHTTPTTGITGTWTAWPTDLGINNQRLEMTYNENGILTRVRMYTGTDMSILGVEVVLEGLEAEEEKPMDFLLLALMAGGGGGLGTEIIILIGVAAAIGVIIVIIVIKKVKG